MAVRTCAWCHSDLIAATTDRYHCINCGKDTGVNGEKYDKPGPYGADELQSLSHEDAPKTLGNQSDPETE